MAGKGDNRRPRQVDARTFEENWARCFGGMVESHDVDEGNPTRVIEKRDWMDERGRWRNSVTIRPRSADDVEGLKIAERLREDIARLNR